ITNNMKLTSTGSLMPKTAENSFKTIKFPKVYVKAKEGVKISGGDWPLYNIPYQNGYYVLDIGATAKAIKPGETMKLTLRLDKAFDKVSDCIDEIYLVQRNYNKAIEFSKTSLYSSDIKEDVNKDGKVDAVDLDLVAAKYNLKSTDTGYDVKCDVNGSGLIDLFDLTRVSKLIGSTPTEPEIPLGTAWKEGIAYKVNDVVSYNNANYICTFAHTSQKGWEPSAAQALWKKQ
ncbi:MAG: carbohydrate-binding protein, partial [Clostridium sp.]